MKHRSFLFLFLFIACTLLAGRAMAQGCTTNPKDFPQPGDADTQVGSNFCIANPDEGPTGQGGRLRWATNGGHALQLFDADDSGELLWCANSGNDNGGSSGPTNCWDIPGSILCLQQDGNMVIYQPQRGGPSTIDCGRTDSDGGQAVWASGTENTLFTTNNDGHEVLVVQEDVIFNNAQRTGDRAVIHNNSKILWVSLGYVD